MMDLKRFLFGDQKTIAGTVYGTIIVLSVLAAGAQTYHHELGRLGAVAGLSCGVLWIAHVYSHGLGESLALGRRLTADELLAIARRERSILLAAVLPVVAIELGAAGVFPGHFAFQLAFVIGVITLAGQGVRYARLERLSAGGTVFTVGVNLALGLTIVGMEAWLAH
jgi:hypothetical protein